MLSYQKQYIAKKTMPCGDFNASPHVRQFFLHPVHFTKITPAQVTGQNDNDPKMTERIKYLSENLDEDQDRDLFDESLKIFKKVIPNLVFDSPPFLSVDDSGNLIAEWRECFSHTLIALLFSPSQISMTAFKEKKIVKKMTGVADEIIKEFSKLNL